MIIPIMLSNGLSISLNSKFQPYSSSNTWDNFLVHFLATRKEVQPPANDPITWGRSIWLLRHPKHQNPFLATREEVVPPGKDPIMLDRSRRSFRHPKHQNPSIILDSIDWVRYSKIFSSKIIKIIFTASILMELSKICLRSVFMKWWNLQFTIPSILKTLL